MWQLMWLTHSHSWPKKKPEHAGCLHRFYVVCLSLMQVGYVRPYWADSHFPACTQQRSVAASTTQAKSLPLCLFSCVVHTAFVITPNSSSPSLPHWLICQSLTTVASFPLSPLFFFFLESPLLFSLLSVLPLSLWAFDYLSPYPLLPPLLTPLCCTSSVCFPFSPPLCLFPSFFFCCLSVPLCE